MRYAATSQADGGAGVPTHGNWGAASSTPSACRQPGSLSSHAALQLLKPAGNVHSEVKPEASQRHQPFLGDPVLNLPLYLPGTMGNLGAALRY